MFFPVFWDLILFFIVIIEAKHTFFLIEPKVYNNLIYSINNESTIYYKSQEIALNKNTTQKIESNNIGFELEKHICNESDLPFISKYYGKETDTTLSLNIEKNINKLSFLLLIKANKCILESSEESPVKLTVRIINNLLTNKVSYKEIDCECRFVSKGESNNTNNFNLDCERDSDIIDIKGFLNSNENGVKATNSDILTHIFTKTEKLEPKPPKGPFLSSSKEHRNIIWREI
ncbi:hypothetical protein FG386_001868 [Cryptosporidium ryanae]|uniref:uncharacterized protein n=1 Tax=Cryptosporidium ryanae TaxID=515981 RepID=UPI003519F00A|nr:hypothetical protein FG386_001868 [Cryptosporidium ryanae]